jgi:hypothetical protein
MIKFLQKLAVVFKKRQFFAQFFGEHIFKILTSAPGKGLLA